MYKEYSLFIQKTRWIPMSFVWIEVRPGVSNLGHYFYVMEINLVKQVNSEGS